MSSSSSKTIIQLTLEYLQDFSEKDDKSTVVENRVDIKYNKDDMIPAKDFAGGIKRGCVDFVSSLGQNVENKKNIGKESVRQKYALIDKFEQNPYRIKPDEYNNNFDALCSDVYNYLKEWENKTDGTLKQIMRYARLMSNLNQPFPIDFFNLNYSQYIYHMKWYKDNFYDEKTGESYYGLKHRRDTINNFLLAYGYNPAIWHYKLPLCPKNKHRHIPPPDIVHKIINYNFYPDNKEKTHLLQYIHAHNFWIGPRPPSELSLLTTDSFNFDEGYIKCIEQKRHYSIRTIYPEDAILKGNTRKSFKNYIDHIRPKFISQYSSNALYIGIRDGKPIQAEYMSNLLSISGKMVYPLFQNYSARHWCATARLIKCWLEKEPDPLDYIQNFMGHENGATTRSYVQQTRVLFKKYPYDWIKSTLKKPNYGFEDSALKSKQRPKTSVSNGNISVEKMWARRDSNS